MTIPEPEQCRTMQLLMVAPASEATALIWMPVTAYSTMACSIMLSVSSLSTTTPVQSPGAGVSAFEVNVTMFSEVPSTPRTPFTVSPQPASNLTVTPT